jgi:DNA-binding CsgD family transcriptional regulator
MTTAATTPATYEVDPADLGRDRGLVRTGWRLLTSAERDVADLVSTGMTNKQIGAALYCSPYTVDSHLRAIYRKLGISSRAALAGHLGRVNEAAQART